MGVRVFKKFPCSPMCKYLSGSIEARAGWQAWCACNQRCATSTQHWWMRALAPIQKEDGRAYVAHRGSRANTCIKMCLVPLYPSSSYFSFPFHVHDRCRDKTREYLWRIWRIDRGGGRIVNLFSRRVDERQGIIDLCCDLEISLLSGHGSRGGRICAAVSIFVKKGVGSLVYSCTLVYSIDFSKEKLRNELTVNYNTIHFCFYIKIG